jgi:hypothetical protein
MMRNFAIMLPTGWVAGFSDEFGIVQITSDKELIRRFESRTSAETWRVEHSNAGCGMGIYSSLVVDLSCLGM